MSELVTEGLLWRTLEANPGHPSWQHRGISRHWRLSSLQLVVYCRGIGVAEEPAVAGCRKHTKNIIKTHSYLRRPWEEIVCWKKACDANAWHPQASPMHNILAGYLETQPETLSFPVKLMALTVIERDGKDAAPDLKKQSRKKESCRDRQYFYPIAAPRTSAQEIKGLQ